MTIEQRIEPTQVTVDWVLQALDGKNEEWDALRARSKVLKCETHPISGAGFLSNVLKLKIQFENGDNFPAILKAPTMDKIKALQSEDFGEKEAESGTSDFLIRYHNQEITFYELIGNQFNGFQLPKLYGYKKSTTTPLFHGQILLEDISHLGRLEESKLGLNLEQCSSVIEAIADFHVYTLSLPNINQVLHLMRNVMDAFHDDEFNFTGRLMALDPYFIEHKEELRMYLKDNCYQTSEPYLMFDIKPLLAHGDLWTNNMFFERNVDGSCGNKLATILDWQCCYPGTGLEDVARFVYTSASLEVLEKHESQLLELYFDRITHGLKANSQPPRFTYEKMVDVFMFHRKHQFIFSVFVLLTVAEKQTEAADRQIIADRLKSTFEKIRKTIH